MATSSLSGVNHKSPKLGQILQPDGDVLGQAGDQLSGLSGGHGQRLVVAAVVTVEFVVVVHRVTVEINQVSVGSDLGPLG